MSAGVVADVALTETVHGHVDRLHTMIDAMSNQAMRSV